MENVYIIGGLRSYIGKKNGIYKNSLPEDIAGELLNKVISKYNLSKIDEIICGNITGTGGNITRLMALKAGIENVPAFTLDMQCASAIEAMHIGMMKITLGEADLIVAGGFESASMEPLKFYNKKDFRYSGDGRIYQAQFCKEDYSSEASYNFSERICKNYGISSKELDYFTMASHKKAEKAAENMMLNDVTESICGSFRDEGIRKNISEKFLKRLPKLNGCTVSSIGNIAGSNDGAALIVLCSEKYLKMQSNIKTRFLIKSFNKTCVDPLLSPLGALKSAENIASSNGMTFEDISAFEFNEAFAAIDVLFARKYEKFLDRYNIFGGALAYGHPYGASGAVIILHLLKVLQYNKGKLGIASVAASGGIGASILIERR